MWSRAIIFGIELVGFVALSIFIIAKFYKRHCSEKDKKYAIENLKFNSIYCTINFCIILAIFLFSYPTLIILSYNKLILVSLIELASILIILLSNLKFNKIRDHIMISITAVCILVTAIIVIDGTIGSKSSIIANNVVILEKKETETITPAIISENQIGYTADLEGNIKTYVFYYKDDNEVWQYEEIKASNAKVERIKDENTYIEKTVINTSYCNQEKKSSEADYIYSEEREKYTIYLNLKQMVEVKTD